MNKKPQNETPVRCSDWLYLGDDMNEFNNIHFNSGYEELYNVVKTRMEINVYNAAIKTFIKFPSLKLDHEKFAKLLAAKAVLMLQEFKNTNDKDKPRPAGVGFSSAGYKSR